MSTVHEEAYEIESEATQGTDVGFAIVSVVKAVLLVAKQLDKVAEELYYLRQGSGPK